MPPSANAEGGISFFQRRFIRSFGVRAIIYIGPRRGPTMLNRMWSEAELAVYMLQITSSSKRELAVYMLQITSSSKRANSCLLFAPFGDGWGGFDLPQVPFPSVTIHAVKHSSPPSGTGIGIYFYPTELRMNHECGLSPCRLPPFAPQRTAKRSAGDGLRQRAGFQAVAAAASWGVACRHATLSRFLAKRRKSI